MIVDGGHVLTDGGGSPAVLLAAGMADSGASWHRLRPLLTGRHRVVSFDRPGLGASPPRTSYPSLAEEADRLDRLIRRLDLGRPVIVAHSAAALHAEAYARRSPDRLAGLVLVDPSGVEPVAIRGQVPRLVRRSFVRAGGVLAGLADAAGLTGAVGPRLWRAGMTGMTDRPADEWATGRTVAPFVRAAETTAALAEWVAYGEMAADLTELRRWTDPPAVPVVVLTALGAARSVAARARRRIEHDRLARSFPAGRQEVVRDSRHFLQLDRPDLVAAAVAACLTG
jgi:pimeloyl-ACP methyl ester carboxylesterase